MTGALIQTTGAGLVRRPSTTLKSSLTAHAYMAGSSAPVLNKTVFE